MSRTLLGSLAVLAALAVPAAADMQNLGIVVPAPPSLWQYTPLAVDAAGKVYAFADDTLYGLAGGAFAPLVSGIKQLAWGDDDIWIDPSGFAVNAAGTLAYVATGYSGRLLEVNLAAKSARELTGAALAANYGLAVDPIYGKVFLTDSYTQDLYLVDTVNSGGLTLMKQFAGAVFGSGVAFSPAGELVVPVATALAKWPTDDHYPVDLYRFSKAWLDEAAAGKTPTAQPACFGTGLKVSGTGFIVADSKGITYLQAADAIYTVDPNGNLGAACGDPSINVFDWDMAGRGFMGLAYDPVEYRLLFAYRGSTATDWTLHEYRLPTAWTGADNHWDTPANWWNGTAPGVRAAAFSGTPAVQPALYRDETAAGVGFRSAGWAVGGSAFTLSVGADGIDSAGSGMSTVAPGVTLTADSRWTVGSGNTLTLNGALDGGGRVLTKEGPGTLRLGRAGNLAGLNLDAGTVVVQPAAGPGVLVTHALSIAGSGTAPSATLDLANGCMIIDYTGDPAASPFEQVKAWIKAGWLGPDAPWCGTGITSTLARDNPDLYAVGFVDQGRLLAETGELWYGPGGTRGETFGGAEVDETSILVKVTYLGDVDLDGKVYDDDVAIMSGNYSKTGPTGAEYWNGDIFGFDGWVYDDEAGIVGGAYNNGRLYGEPMGALAGPGAMPEPATLALILAGGAALAARRRHHSQPRPEGPRNI